MKHFFLGSTLFFISFFSVHTTFAAINFTVTPIRYEIEMYPGDSKTLPASLRNNGDTTVTLPTTTSDFVARDGSGVPTFVRKSEVVFADQQLSTWITLSEPSITLAPGEEKSIDFTIQVPEDATPGGHYAAVFFKNPGSEVGVGGNIGINVDYGILVLLTVKGKIVVDPDIEDPIISVGGGHVTIKDHAWYLGQDNNNNPVFQYEDNCLLGDFTKSKYDHKCFDLPFSENTSNTPSGTGSEPLLFSNDEFDINFTVPIKNNGNIHIKPGGKIILTDDKGNTIKAIGKESILNEYGAVIGEKVVDYIPFNDEGGNVLPGSKRLFESSWKGFPYQSYDENGKQIMKFWTPSEYYTQQNKDKAGFLMPWERVSEIRQTKNIHADIEVVYQDENGKDIVFNSAKEFKVQYIEQQITNNPYVILGILIVGSAGCMMWFGIRWWFLVARKRKCWKCKEIIKAHWETCPYCKTLQNKTEYKKFEKQKSIIQEIPKVPIKRGRKKKEVV